MPTLATPTPWPIEPEWETPPYPVDPRPILAPEDPSSPASVHAASNNRRSSNSGTVPSPTDPDWRLRNPPSPFAGLEKSRRQTIAALTGGDRSPEVQRMGARVAACCSQPHFATDSHGLPYLCVPRCRCRMCPLCQRQRAVELSARLGELVAAMNSPRMITLTLKSSPDPLRDQLTRLAAAFRRLRQQERWEDLVDGGVLVIEVTRHRGTGLYHPHLHCITTGRFFPQPQLKAMWKKATGDSDVVWISAVADRRASARYLAKYVAKSADLYDWPQDTIADFAAQTRGLRMCGTFGCLRSETLVADHDEPEPRGHGELCTMASLRYAVSVQMPEATEVVTLLSRLAPEWARRCGFDPTDAPSDCPTAADWERLTMLLSAIPILLSPDPTLTHPPPDRPPMPVEPAGGPGAPQGSPCATAPTPTAH